MNAFWMGSYRRTFRLKKVATYGNFFWKLNPNWFQNSPQTLSEALYSIFFFQCVNLPLTAYARTESRTERVRGLCNILSVSLFEESIAEIDSDIFETFAICQTAARQSQQSPRYIIRAKNAYFNPFLWIYYEFLLIFNTPRHSKKSFQHS